MTEDMVKEKIIYYSTARIFNEGTGITMESVAKDLGMSKKTLYKHFKNRTDLINEVIDRILLDVSSGFKNIIEDSNDRFIGMCEAFSRFANVYAPKFSKRLFEDIRKNEPQIWEKVDNFRINKFRNFFPPIIKEGIEKQYFRSDINPDIVLLMYISSIQGIINPEILSHSSFSTKEAANQIITTLYYGITTPKGKKKFDKYFKNVTEKINEN